MSRSILVNTVIGSGIRVGYIAVSGDSTLDTAMQTLHEFDRRLRRDHIWGAIIDYRELRGFPEPGDWDRFVRRLRWKVPTGLRSAIIRGDHPEGPLSLAVAAIRDAGARVEVFDGWQGAAVYCGLSPDEPDPLEDFQPLLVD